MKAQALTIAGILLAVLPLSGLGQKTQHEDASSFQKISSYSTTYLERAARNLRAGLNSGNEGAVETAVAYSSFLRVAAPQLEMSDIREELAVVAVSGSTPAIRYKAFLATIVFENPTAFESALRIDGIDGDRFFAEVSEQASKTLFGYRSN